VAGAMNLLEVYRTAAHATIQQLEQDGDILYRPGPVP
jgi:hypothetical protein